MAKNASALKPIKSKDFALVLEPSFYPCDGTKKWKIRMLRSELTKRYSIQVKFPTLTEEWEQLTISAGARADYDQTRRELSACSARLPSNKKQANEFIEKLMQAIPASHLPLASQPGFRDAARKYVMPYTTWGNLKNRPVYEPDSDDKRLAPAGGTLSKFQNDVLSRVLVSPYLSIAVLIAIASPLMSYVKQRSRKAPLIAESAIFHFAAGSSTGKSLCAKIASSCFGSLEIDVDYGVSDRGLAEAAYERNDLALIIDDADQFDGSERDLVRKMKMFAMRIPKGSSRKISRSVKSVPRLTWSCFAISTGPRTLAGLAKQEGIKLTGERPRWYDIDLPSDEDGGVLGSTISAARRPADREAFIAKLEDAMEQNYGALWEPWIRILLKYDRISLIKSLVEEFVSIVAPTGGGLDVRIAKKFGVLYAAGVLAITFNLLPWPPAWPLEVVRHCYLKARLNRMTEAIVIQDAIKKIALATSCPMRFPEHRAIGRSLPVFGPDAVGLSIVRPGGVEIYLKSDRIHLLGIDPTLEEKVIQQMKSAKLLKASGNVTGSEQVRYTYLPGRPEKGRFWRLDPEEVDRWIVNVSKGSA